MNLGAVGAGTGHPRRAHEGRGSDNSGANEFSPRHATVSFRCHREMPPLVDCEPLQSIDGYRLHARAELYLTGGLH